MVNEKRRRRPDERSSAKGRLLAILRGDPAFCFSGEILADKLGISRVAVWKTVNSLRAAGYPILTETRGYSWGKQVSPLSGKDDFLYPWEFGDRESSFHHLISTDSTMNRAAELAARNCSGGTVITAEEQTAGRGRNGHRWASGLGGLFFTLLERPAVNAAEYYRVSLGIQIAAAKALGRICGRPVSIRWPNDLYAGEKKIAGILTEFHAEGDRVVWMSLGVGINVNNAPRSREFTNCSRIAGRPLSRQEVLRAVLAEWESAKKDLRAAKLRREWNSLAWGVGNKAAAVMNGAAPPEEPVLAKGIFMGIDARGRGILSDEKKNRLFFDPGIISLKFGGYST